MGILVCILFCTICIILVKIVKTVQELKEALQLKRHFLLDKPSALLRRLGFEELITEANELVDGYTNYAKTQSDRLNQLEATLGSIQESVIIFSSQHVIEYANQSAQRLFRKGAMIKGLRLESVLRSFHPVDFLDTYFQNEHDFGSQQISLQLQPGKILWFEVSCAKIHGLSELNEVSNLLVLHDITQLKNLEQIRRKFVANVSHELRTPLTIIKGYVEALLEDNTKLPEETRARFLDKIARNTKRLNMLVEDILTLSRLESTPEEIKPELHSLQEMLEEAIEDYRSRIASKKQKIVLEFDDQIGEFAFDRLRIQQVFDNLIENAFKHAPEFTLIKVNVAYDAMSNMIQCSVSDDGPGVPEKDLPHIFERFYRVDKGRSYDGGSGLGLSIMKHIVQQHNGTVSAESTLKKGTTVHFNLPYLNPSSSAETLQDSAKDISQES